MEDFPWVKEDPVSDCLVKSDAHKFMGPVDVPMSVEIASRNDFCGEWEWCLKTWGKTNITQVFKKGKKEVLGSYRPVGLTSVPGKLMEQLIVNVISKQVG